MTEPYELPDRDLKKGHPLLQERWPRLLAELERELRTSFLVNEVFRPNIRQQWLYGQGRTIEQCQVKGVPERFARAGDIVTNAWSAAVGAHGWLEAGDPPTLRTPASCALDVVPLGSDGKPWSKDDPWDAFVALTTEPGSVGYRIGLVHFHSAGKAVSDKPHLQLVEWSDAEHRLILPSSSPGGPGGL